MEKKNQTLNIAGEGFANNEFLSIKAVFVKLYQSFLLLITDQEEYGIGTVTLSVPPITPGISATSSPFSIFGLKNNLLANVLGKKASSLLNVPVLSLIMIKGDLKPETIMELSLKATQQAIEQIQNKLEKK